MNADRVIIDLKHGEDWKMIGFNINQELEHVSNLLQALATLVEFSAETYRVQIIFCGESKGEGR